MDSTDSGVVLERRGHMPLLDPCWFHMRVIHLAVLHILRSLVGSHHEWDMDYCTSSYSVLNIEKIIINI